MNGLGSGISIFSLGMGDGDVSFALLVNTAADFSHG